MSDSKKPTLSYHDLVDYDIADPAKVLAQKEGRATAKNLPFGFKEVEGTRGESAYVFDMGDMYGALVQEGLGTKSLIAQSMYDETGESHFASIAQDTVATFVNDLISVGATPVVSNAYWSSGSYKWLADRTLTEDFIQGWRKACDLAGITWGGGETQSLPGIVQENVLEFAGCAFGVIKNKNRLISEKNIKVNDAVILIESNGVHANGISLTRLIASKLKDGYQTKLSDGTRYGDALLAPTHIYATVIESLFENGINIHYLSNITGHGWRKLMRATAEYTYRFETVPGPHEVFDFIAKHAGNDITEMYSNYNMGAGYAVYLPANEAKKAQEIITNCGLKSWIAGHVEAGPKRIIIEPLNIIFEGKSLGVR